jgi:hypothetical protein
VHRGCTHRCPTTQTHSVRGRADARRAHSPTTQHAPHASTSVPHDVRATRGPSRVRGAVSRRMQQMRACARPSPSTKAAAAARAADAVSVPCGASSIAARSHTRCRGLPPQWPDQMPNNAQSYSTGPRRCPTRCTPVGARGRRRASRRNAVDAPDRAGGPQCTIAPTGALCASADRPHEASHRHPAHHRAHPDVAR